MPLETSVMIAAIQEHSEGLALVASEHLDARIEHCPGWNMEDLLGHLVEVHRFWSVIVEEGLDQPPQLEAVALQSGAPLIEQFRQGSRRLTDVLASADQDRAVWTWAPRQHDVAFVTRHQVQEIAVHHWDGANATGVDLDFDPAVASDAIEEFLTCSTSTELDPAQPPRAALDGTLALVCTDVARGWTVRDGSVPGTVAFRDGIETGVAELRATSSQLLLWLYSRREIIAGENVSTLAGRLRDLTFTD